jgi:hypothetical protein
LGQLSNTMRQNRSVSEIQGLLIWISGHQPYKEIVMGKSLTREQRKRDKREVELQGRWVERVARLDDLTPSVRAVMVKQINRAR